MSTATPQHGLDLHYEGGRELPDYSQGWEGSGMNREEAIEHIWEATQQVIQEYCVYPSEIDGAERECIEALLALGVQPDEIAQMRNRI